MAWYGKIPSAELKRERSRELENLIEYEAFDEVHELGIKLATWFGLTSGVETKSDHDCVRQCKAEQSRDETLAGTPQFFLKILDQSCSKCKILRILILDISVALIHARTDEEIDVKTKHQVESIWAVEGCTQENT